ncbi:putative membrane protein YrrS [Robertmurraya siralis]|uniref:Membrane protein YrrS n=1 Tax=Robertmurraya siralis TaxID=77777 RepID=A0A919WEK1_9BACI|nr:YrrS family protein [Robertmurraya siralis]PAE21904.1 hypothetical protein CHH80_04240 [Bacillus sp. 7504-2]GIN60368.1 putative membrane protein YrrS [Robertmurraya siralis]
MNNEYDGSRYQRRTKERKKNVILNSLIGIVLILIILVSYYIFSGNGDEENTQQQEIETEERGETEESPEEAEKESTVDETEPIVDAEEETMTEEVEQSPSNDEEEIVTEGGSDSNVIRTIVNPGWEPVGTVQTGVHVNQYDGIDWDEMVKAIHYATGLAENNMTIHFLGNNGPNKSVGTVYSKNKAEIYRVYIEWVDGRGWKPTKVEELAEIR